MNHSRAHTTSMHIAHRCRSQPTLELMYVRFCIDIDVHVPETPAHMHINVKLPTHVLFTCICLYQNIVDSISQHFPRFPLACNGAFGKAIEIHI